MDYDEQGKLMAEYLHTRSRVHHLQSEGESSHMSPSFASQNHRIMWLLENWNPSFSRPHLFRAIFFCASRQSISISGQRREGREKRQLRVGAVELRGVTLFIWARDGREIIECDGCKWRERDNEQRIQTLIGKGLPQKLEKETLKLELLSLSKDNYDKENSRRGRKCTSKER